MNFWAPFNNQTPGVSSAAASLIPAMMLTSQHGYDLFAGLPCLGEKKGEIQEMDSSSNVIRTGMIDLTGVDLGELTDPAPNMVQQAAAAVVHETTSPLLVSVAGHNS
jgi:hypothetical protein